MSIELYTVVSDFLSARNSRNDDVANVGANYNKAFPFVRLAGELSAILNKYTLGEVELTTRLSWESSAGHHEQTRTTELPRAAP